MGPREYPLTDAELERVKKVRAVLADGSARRRRALYAVQSSVGGGWVCYSKGQALAIFREQVRTNTLPATRPFDRVDYVPRLWAAPKWCAHSGCTVAVACSTRRPPSWIADPD